MEYKTQREAARLGVITPEMEMVAEQERIEPEELLGLIAEGVVVIPANRKHRALRPKGIGNRLTTKINVNLGVSKDCCLPEMELSKVNRALELGADAIMDLSSAGDTRAFRKSLIENCPAMIGTVPVYDAVLHFGKELEDITEEEWLQIVEEHAKDGVDFLTVHCGITRRTMETLESQGRLTNIVSRGGALLFAWMKMTGKENPYYEYYDKVLEVCREYDVTISLGDACRPGCLKDATDACQIEELITLGELTKRAWEKGVQVMVEGPGHVPLDQIAANMKVQQQLCHGAPFYVLGPLVTDVAPGYDHITSAIGGAIAASSGASFLCYVTPAEHLRLPDLADMEEGIIASKIAAHAADIAKGLPGARDWDDKMSAARANLDWQGMFELAIDGGEKGRRYHDADQEEETCTMCGKFCSVRNMNKALNNEKVSIL